MQKGDILITVLSASLSLAAIAPAASQTLPTVLSVSATFQPYSTISLSVDVNMGVVPWCDTEQWNGVDVSGSNGYYTYWYTNYQRGSFYFTDTVMPRSYQTVGYWAASFADASCDSSGTFAGGDSASSFPAAPEPVGLRVLFEGYTGNHGACPAGTTSPWYYWRGYQVVDQWGLDYRYQTALSEQIDTYQNSCDRPFSPANGSNPLGEFTDRFALCGIPRCISGEGCEARSYQYLYANGAYVRGTHLTYTCSDFVISDEFTP